MRPSKLPVGAAVVLAALCLAAPPPSVQAQRGTPHAPAAAPDVRAATAALPFRALEAQAPNGAAPDVTSATLDERPDGDGSRFVGDQVRLFYFTDVSRLMRVLNENTRQYPEQGADSQAAAAQARQDLIGAETAAAAGLTAVNEAKTSLRQVQEEIRLVNARAADAAKEAATARVLLRRLQKQQADLSRKVTQAQADPATTPAALQALQDQQAVLNARADSASTAAGNADTAAAQAEDAQAQLAAQSAALPQELLDAQAAEAAARADLDRERVLAANRAQIEADAFAGARDDAPYLEALPNAASRDPAQRVLLFAYPDSRTLYVRGLPADVEKVKEIVADFDRPVPQARITLWTLQFNGSFSKDLSAAVQQVDQRLLLTRTNIGLVQDVLRDSISSVVNDEAGKSRLTGGEDSNGRLRRYAFYQSEVLRRLGYDLRDGGRSLPDVPAAPAAHADAALYTEDFVNDDAFVTRFTLPDPIDATTLGEMMFVLSLATQTNRERVLQKFYDGLAAYVPSRLPNLPPNDPQNQNLERFVYGILNFGVRGSSDPREINALGERLGLKIDRNASAADSARLIHREGFYPRFPSAILGSFPGDADGAAGSYQRVTPNQNEILLAIQSQARDNVASEIRQAIQNVGELPEDQQLRTRAAHQYRMQYLPLVGFLYTTNKPDSAATRAMTWLQRGLVATGVLLPSDPPLSLDECEKRLIRLEQRSASDPASLAAALAPAAGDDNSAVPQTVGSVLLVDRQAWIIARTTGQHNSLSRATPRVAAADDMIKRLVITAEDDLDYFFVQPALEGIRQDVSARGMEFGSLQRESILASNRLAARVDPRANADPELPSESNFLDETAQLAGIADRFRQEQTADKITSSGPAALAGTLSLLGDRAGSALGIGAAASLLGDLLARPAPPGEIYSINSGSLFQVTPIFDPSGQALRFRFDYAGTTDVREPDKTTNPSFPRVERHTVNTEVQLTNLELREVSRFESNSALGVPQVRTGGVPLIKHLPLIRDIPILGYFTQTGGQKAVRQESLIFAQTSIYPTVSDIVNLLVDVPPVSGLDTEPPAYLQLTGEGAAVTPSAPAPAPASAPTTARPGGALPRRSRAKQTADVSDFILPPEMQSR